MKLVFLAAMAAGLAMLALAARAAAAEAGKALLLVPREAIATTLVQSLSQHAPFVADPGGAEPDLDFVPHPEARRGSPSSCDGDKTLCYDPQNGHIVYKPARKLMPEIPGLQRENISVRRDRVVFRYSF